MVDSTVYRGLGEPLPKPIPKKASPNPAHGLSGDYPTLTPGELAVLISQKEMTPADRLGAGRSECVGPVPDTRGYGGGNGSRRGED